jgi:hypothetical protein
VLPTCDNDDVLARLIFADDAPLYFSMAADVAAEMPENEERFSVAVAPTYARLIEDGDEEAELELWSSGDLPEI